MSGDAENFGMADDLYETSKLEVRHGLLQNKAVRHGFSLKQPILIKSVMENFQSVKMALLLPFALHKDIQCNVDC